MPRKALGRGLEALIPNAGRLVAPAADPDTEEKANATEKPSAGSTPEEDGDGTSAMKPQETGSAVSTAEAERLADGEGGERPEPGRPEATSASGGATHLGTASSG